MGNSNSALRTLPVPSGPYSVGFADIMRGFAFEGVFLRLYYPIEKRDISESPYLRPWLCREEYLEGYAAFARVPYSILRVLYSWWIGDIFVPAFYGVPVIMTAAGEEEKPTRFPVILFSHGLLANRTTYTTICTDLASHGFIVAALEHRDGSASYSYSLVENDSSSAKTTSAEQKRSGHDYQEIPVPYRTIGRNEKEFYIRHEQVRIRVEECNKALDVLRTLDQGREIENLMPEGQEQIDWKMFKGRLDFERLGIMGHSFGGATVIAAVADNQRYKAGVVLDGWMFPLHNDIYPKVKSPLLFVNMDGFQWRDNILRMKRLDSTSVERLMFTVKGSVHQNQTDFAFLVKGWLARKLCARGETDPLLCNDINNELCLAFLRKHLDVPGTSVVEDVFQHYEQWLTKGTNIELDEIPHSSL